MTVGQTFYLVKEVGDENGAKPTELCQRYVCWYDVDLNMVVSKLRCIWREQC